MPSVKPAASEEHTGNYKTSIFQRNSELAFFFFSSPKLHHGLGDLQTDALFHQCLTALLANFDIQEINSMTKE